MPTHDSPAVQDADAVATLAGGCFWCLEAVYGRMRGVTGVQSGYTGGYVNDPSYEEVCGGATGHAEAVRIRFDPKLTTFTELLEVFFAIHDPTTPNRQGNDVGTQYRSAIFYHSDEQRRAAEEVIGRLAAGGVYGATIVTEVKPAGAFWPAEIEHERYFERNPRQPYCVYVVRPKVEKFAKHFADRTKTAST